MDDQSRRSPFLHAVQGLLMGSADAIPGVSGGTVALIVGIYEELLFSIGSGFRAIIALVTGDVAGSVQRMRSIRWSFLAPLLGGIATAIAIASTFLPDLLEQYPIQSRALFLGLVAASIVIPWTRIERPSPRLVLIGVMAAIPAFVFSGLPGRDVTDPPLWAVFGGAAVAICAMILPGVSGAFLLLVLGIYEATLDALARLDLVYVGVFIVGAILGLGTFSILLRRLLDRHHDVTMAVLVGLMAGSLRALWPWQDVDRAILAPGDSVAVAVALMAVGVVSVLALRRAGEKRAAG